MRITRGRDLQLKRKCQMFERTEMLSMIQTETVGVFKLECEGRHGGFIHRERVREGICGGED